jgi:phosphate-selective porin OprO/OprP
LASFRLCLVLLLLGAGHVLPMAARAADQAGLQNRLDHPIHSLLMEKESPVLGVQWSGELFMDLPFGNEPPGAEPTLRLAKLRFHRQLGPNWQVKLTADYNTGGDFELNDSYLVYSGWSAVLVKLGFSKPPFSLESVSASSAHTFMEPALPAAALAERRSGGVSVIRRTASSIVNASLMVVNPDEDGLSSAGQSVVLHYVHAPLDIAGREGVNIGGSFVYRVNTQGKDSRFRSRPEVATANIFFVDTGEIDGADQELKFGLEASQVQGRFSWQSEWLLTRVQRSAAEAVSFRGGYFYASWFLTADTRNYDQGQGKFVPVQVSNPFRRGGWGAFEVAVRASYLDLQDGDIAGGQQSNLSLGLNWYVNDQVRLMANVIKVLDVDRPGSEFDGSDPLIFAMRLQWLLL